MPHLARLMKQGVHGAMRTLYPVLSPMLWTSIATGKRAWKHGIHGFAEPIPGGRGARPITVLSRRTKAVWNILNQSGLRCNVVAWWPSHPAEPLNGAVISNHVPVARQALGKPWEFPPHSVHPAGLAGRIAPLLLHPGDLAPEHLLPFIPLAAKVDQEKDPRISHLAKTLSEAVNVQSMATALLQNEPSDFMAVYFDAIDHFSHGFMRYHPPRLPAVSEEDFTIYNGVIEGAYRFHDLMLGTLLDMVGPDCAVLLISDHGFHPDHQRLSSIPNEPAGPAAEHGTHGICVLRAPGVSAGRRIHGATLLDIAPTILHLFGLPVGRDMDGRVLAEFFDPPAEPQFIDTWDKVHGPHHDGTHLPGECNNPYEDAASLRQLSALGYIDPPPEDALAAAEFAQEELDYNMALSLLDGSRAEEALASFVRLWDRRPTTHRFGIGALRCLLCLERIPEARQTFEEIKRRKAADAAKAAAELAALRRETHPPATDEASARQRLRKLRLRAATNLSSLRRIEAQLLLAEGKPSEALAVLEEDPSADLETTLRRAEILVGQNKIDAAEALFHEALRLDPESGFAQLGLARCRLGQRRILEAAALALAAAELEPQAIPAHFILGVSLQRLRQPELAEKAFRRTLQLAPYHLGAHRRLAALYSRRLKNPELAAIHRETAILIGKRMADRGEQTAAGAPELARDPGRDLPPAPTRPPPKGLFKEVPREEIVTVVSGLPRSGTSLLMQMLIVGGLPLLTDNHRPADENNRRGYYEDARVKSLHRDSSWLGEARGKAVKIIAQQLPHLPRSHRYRVLLIERNIDEVLASQKAMISQLGSGESSDPATLRAVYLRQLARLTNWLDLQPHIDTLYLRYADLLTDPSATLPRIADFLDTPLTISAMAAAIDPSLYRQRK